MTEAEVEADTTQVESEEPEVSSKSSKEATRAKKKAYFERLISLFDEYPRVLLVGADNVGSRQMQQIRKSLRGRAVLLMGKNTMIRRAIKMHLSKHPALECLLPKVKGNFGFVFTKEELQVIRSEIEKYKVDAPARVGSLAPIDVIIPKGLTGLDPSQTSFMQALNITTKINKSQIEILNDVHLVKAGEKVGSSEATLLGKLNIKPFSFGLIPIHVYEDGFVFAPTILDLKSEDLLARFRTGIQNVAALGVAINFPTIAGIPHYFAKAYRNLLAISLATDYTFERAKKLKALLEDPEALAALQASAPAASSEAAPAAAETSAPAEPEKKEEEEEEEDGAGFGDLFG